jgi:hypothetical protein
MRERGSSERAQASVELIAAIPALLLLALLVVQAGLAGWTLWSAQNAARAGSRAAAVGGDPEAAARSALPGQLREGATVQGGDVIRVRVQAPRVASTVPPFNVEAGAHLQGPADGTP